MKRGASLRATVLALTLVHEAVFVIFPIWYSVMTGFLPEQDMLIQVEPVELMKVIIGEALFVTMFAVGITIKSRSKRRIFETGPTRIEKMFLKILALIGCIIYAFAFVNILIRVGDLPTGLMEMIKGWLEACFVFSPIIACALIVTRPGSIKSKGSFLLALLPLASLLFIGFFSGVRGRITWVISLLLVGGFLHRQKKAIWTGIAVASIFFASFNYLSGPVRKIYQTEAWKGSSVQDLVVSILSQREDMSADFIFTDLLSEFARRAMGPRNSVVLYRLFEANQGASYTVYTGSILFPIPRMLWPQKPLPGSTDENLESAAIYRVISIGHGLPYMGPILASAHAYWEGGWVWLLACGLITGFLWNIVLRWANSLPDSVGITVCLCFSASLLIDGFLTALTPIYSLILGWWKMVLPVLIVYKVAQLFGSGSAKSINKRRITS